MFLYFISPWIFQLSEKNTAVVAPIMGFPLKAKVYHLWAFVGELEGTPPFFMLQQYMGLYQWHLEFIDRTI